MGRSLSTEDDSEGYRSGMNISSLIMFKHINLHLGLQVKVPFGDCVVSTQDTCIGVELCEELFTPARSAKLELVLRRLTIFVVHIF